MPFMVTFEYRLIRFHSLREQFMFDALLLTQEDKRTFAQVSQITEADLPEGKS